MKPKQSMGQSKLRMENYSNEEKVDETNTIIL